MLLSHPCNPLPKPRALLIFSSPVRLDFGLKISKRAYNSIMFAKGLEDRIRKVLSKVELSVSSYDTAWVAMVPSLNFPQSPCFPKCIDWILENQHLDGSWGFYHFDPSLLKDALSSSLACILALKRWSVGEEHIKRGLHFIGSNFLSAMDDHFRSPIGFSIIFPGMVEYAINMGLELPVNRIDINSVLCMRTKDLERCGYNSEGTKAYLAYVAEGLGKLQDWKEIMKYQKKNGSLFNSPSTTAASLIYSHDAKALEYLYCLLQKFGNSVPTIYPADVKTHLCIIDNLEKLGISRHFGYEIHSILDRTYRYWVQKDEEIMSDISTASMAFRLLRMNGYDISFGSLAQYDEEKGFNGSMHGHLEDINAVLELYRASEIKTSPEEEVLKKLNSWSTCFLKDKMLSNMTNEPQDVSRKYHVDLCFLTGLTNVDYALKFPFYANLERLEHKWNIEHCNINNVQTLKTSYIIHGFYLKDILELALEDFNSCQSTYRKELNDLERWVKEHKLGQLKFARQKVAYSYFSAAATLFSPEISDARICWAKNAILATVVDDFFDIGGSREELLNLISLVERWDRNWEKESCSEQVNIVFSALHSTINELGVKASACQNRYVTNHMVEIWLSLMKSMMKETEWTSKKSVPTLEEYMENAYVSFGLGPIILPALYFAGPNLPEDVIRDPEYDNLFRLVSTSGRILNDVQGFEREGKDGKLNSVSLRVLHSEGSISEENAKKEALSLANCNTQELLRLVLQREGSVVPRACKDFFWKMSKVLHLFYMRTDGFTSPKEMMRAVNAVIYEPLEVSHLSVNENAGRTT